MSYWNHRVVRKVYPGAKPEWDEVQYEITEVYYDDNGRPDGWCRRTHSPYGNDLEDLRGELERMLGALSKPVLVVIEGKLVEYHE